MSNEPIKRRLKEIIVSPEGTVRYEFWGASDEIIEFDIDIRKDLDPFDNAITTLLCLALEQTKEIMDLKKRLDILENNTGTKVY